MPSYRRPHAVTARELAVWTDDPLVVLMIGVAGAGKSPIAAALAAQRPGAVVISYDGCRAELTGDAGNQTATAAAVALAHARLADRCQQGLSTILDATNVRREHRQAVLAIADSHQLPAVAVLVATPLETCLARQAQREPGVPGGPAHQRWGRRVPEAVVREQHADLMASLPDLTTEGYTAIHILDGGADHD